MMEKDAKKFLFYYNPVDKDKQKTIDREAFDF